MGEGGKRVNRGLFDDFFWTQIRERRFRGAHFSRSSRAKTERGSALEREEQNRSEGEREAEMKGVRLERR